MRLLLAMLALSVLSGSIVTAQEDAPAKEGEKAAAAKIRFSLLPSASEEELTERGNRLANYLSDASGLEVEFVYKETYGDVAKALTDGNIQFARLSGVSLILTDKKAEDVIEVLCCSEEDKKNRSVFIAPQSSKLNKVESLADLKGKVAGMVLTLGATGSASGYYMPRYFFHEQADVLAEDWFKSCKLLGSPSKVLKGVSEGETELAAISKSVYDEADEETKAATKLIYETPEYNGFAFAIRKSVGAKDIRKIRDAMLALKAEDSEHKEVLDDFDATKFVKADIDEWEGLRWAIEAYGG